MTTTSVKRREFLKAAGGVLGAGTLAKGLGISSAMGAEVSKVDPAKTKEELEKLCKELQAVGRGYLCVPRKDGELLNLLVKTSKAQNILEIGTSIGTSTVWISLGLEETGGRMTTLEILPERVQMAKENIAKAGLSHRVTFKEGDAHQIVPTLEGPFDFVFLDADKQGQVDYFNKLFPKKIAPGGLLVSHNAIRQKEDLKEYLDLVGKHPAFDTVLVSATMDDGFALSYRHKA